MFHRYIAVAASAVLLSTLSLPVLSQDSALKPAAAGSQRALLADVHKAKGIKCKDCHAEVPPADPVPTAKCLSCHGGSTAKLAAATHAEPNPHASHQGEQECKACHRAHEPSVDDCGRCHATSWIVP